MGRRRSARVAVERTAARGRWAGGNNGSARGGDEDGGGEGSEDAKGKDAGGENVGSDGGDGDDGKRGWCYCRALMPPSREPASWGGKAEVSTCSEHSWQTVWLARACTCGRVTVNLNCRLPATVLGQAAHRRHLMPNMNAPSSFDANEHGHNHSSTQSCSPLGERLCEAMVPDPNGTDASAAQISGHGGIDCALPDLSFVKFRSLFRREKIGRKIRIRLQPYR